MKYTVKVSFISYNEVVQVVKLKIKKRREHISCNSKFVTVPGKETHSTFSAACIRWQLLGQQLV